jgi:hypothetical protein
MSYRSFPELIYPRATRRLFVANVQVTVGGVLFPIRIPERRLIAREAHDFLAKRSRDLPEQL